MTTRDRGGRAPGSGSVDDEVARDEAERIEKLSDAELDAELRREGIDPARVPTAEQLLARAAGLAAARGPASPGDEADPARGWQFVENELAQDEAERIETLGDAELDAELRREGIDPARAPTAEQLLARAAALAPASPPVERRSVPPVRVPPVPAKPKAAASRWSRGRMAGALLLAAAFGVVLVFVVNGQPDIVVQPHFRSPREVAEELRDDAEQECARGAWGACADRLDDARRLDPAGESEARVQAARRAVGAAGHAPDAAVPGRPRP